MQNGPIGLAHIGLPCIHFRESLEFWKSLGFEPNPLKENVAMVNLGNCTIELYQRRDDCREKSVGIIDHIALVTENIDKSYEEIKAKGYSFISEGIQSNQTYAPKSNRFFTFLGPDGVRIEFAQVK